MNLNYQKKIYDIERILRENDCKYESMGINNGILGLSLFYYYLYLYSKDTKYLDNISDYIAKAFNGFALDYKGFSSTKDIIEIGHYLHFLKRNNILEDDINNYLEDADTIVLDFLDKQLSKKNIDPVIGMISSGYYLLNRCETKDYTEYIEKIIYTLEDLAIVNENRTEIKWTNNYKEEESIKELQLGFTHGMSGIINFILSVYEKGILKSRCEQLLIPALHFLLTQKGRYGVNLFPFETLNNEKIDYQNLCYGDLGIGYVFLRAGKIMQHDPFSKIGMEVLDNSTKFSDDSNTHIKDGNLLYGASGLFSFFDQLYKYTGNQVFKKSSEYWFQKMLSHNYHDTPWLGYQSYYNQHSDSTQLCFLEGICGIGISIIAHELDSVDNHLVFLNYTFKKNEIFMLPPTITNKNRMAKSHDF